MSIESPQRYPILRHLAPELSGFIWIKDVIAKTDKNLEAIINLHKRRDENYNKTEANFGKIIFPEDLEKDLYVRTFP